MASAGLDTCCAISNGASPCLRTATFLTVHLGDRWGRGESAYQFRKKPELWGITIG